MPFKVGDALIEVKPELIKGFETGLAAALSKPLVAATGGLGQSIEDLGGKLTTRLTIPLGLAAVAATAQFSGLDEKLRQSVILFGETGEAADRRWESLRSTVNRVSDDVGVFERDVAAAVEAALSTEVSAENVFSFVSTAAQAAVGGSVDLDIAVSGLTTAVNTFTDQMLTAQQASDVMFRGVVRGATTFEELSDYMNQVAPLAAAAGVSFEELIAATSTMTVLGTPTRSAFTNIKSAMTGLLRPTADLVSIFNAAGFASADMAVKEIGLQGALELVADAAEGQVGTLITLLGGAEAANAVLQVTGENSDLFTSVLRDMETASGATSAAFEVMSDSASHTFQELTVQLDQLGNFGGQILYTVVGPLTKAATAIIGVGTGIMGSFSRLPEPIQQVGTGLYGLTLTIGPLLSVLGVLLSSRTGGLLALSGVFRLLGTGGLIKTVIGGFAAFLIPLTQTTNVLKPLTDRLINVKKWGLEPLTTALSRLTLQYTLVGVAVVAAGIAFKVYQDYLQDVEDQQLTTTEGVRALAESLELVAKPLSEMALNPEAGITIDFRAENTDLIQELQDAEERGLLENRLIQVAFQLQLLGNTPEDIQLALDQLTEAAGVVIPVTFDLDTALDPTAFAQAAVTDLNTAIGQMDFSRFGEGTGGSVGQGVLRAFSEAARETEGELTNLANKVTTLFATGTPEGIRLATELWGYFNETLGEGTAQADFMTDEILKTLDAGRGVGFVTSGYTSFADAIQQVNDKLALQPAGAMTTMEAGLQGSLAAADELRIGLGLVETAALEASRAGYDPEAAAQRKADSETALAALGEFRTTVDEAAQSIQDAFVVIFDEITAGISLFGEYEGAAKLNVKKIINSVTTFAEDTRHWVDVADENFADIPAGLREHLDQLPLDQRAALATLAEENPTQFEKVKQAYVTAWRSLKRTARQEWRDELPTIVEQANAMVEEKARELAISMDPLGADAATAFRTGFVRIAATWADVAGFYVSDVITTVNSTLDRNSPSRVFIAIGEDVGRGFIVGLESMEGAATTAIKGMIETGPHVGDRVGAPGVDKGAFEDMGREITEAIRGGVRGSLGNTGVEVTGARRVGVPDVSNLRASTLLDDLGRLPL